MRSLAILVLSVALTTSPSPAQSPGKVRGEVRKAADSSRLADVLIRRLDQTQPPSVSTGPTGRFELAIGPGTMRLLVSRIGFRPESLTVAAGTDSLTIFLQPAPLELSPITVAGEAAMTAASSRAIREVDLHLRPRETAQYLLRLVPGLTIAQHAGGGKAEQIFLRGFDADHGTDVAVAVDGVPVNLVSHAHGQGYADLHFLMPEVVERGEVRKGPYDAADGDIATAGAVDFRTRDRVNAPALELRGGSFHTLHGIGLFPFGGDVGQTGGYLAASAHYSDGPFLSRQHYDRWNGFGKLTAPLGRNAILTLAGSSFGSSWDASGQIPERAVRSGQIDRFGSIDDSEGGRTSRHDLRLGIRSSGGAERDWEVQAWAVKYDFRLFSNFTFFLADTLNGDGIEQDDDRFLGGLTARMNQPFAGGTLSAGTGTRADFTDVELNTQTRRETRDQLVDARVRQQQYFGWVRQSFVLGPSVRLQLGVRGDLFRFEVPTGGKVRTTACFTAPARAPKVWSAPRRVSRSRSAREPPCSSTADSDFTPTTRAG